MSEQQKRSEKPTTLQESQDNAKTNQNVAKALEVVAAVLNKRKQDEKN